MNSNRRAHRNVFAVFLGTAFIALVCALPIVAAQTQQQERQAQQERNASAAVGGTRPAPVIARPAPDHPGFAQADRNKDGLLDKSEAGVVPGLSANFERADANRDGKLDEVEFARGLEILQVRR
jgi:hypothetical protein